LVIVEEFTKLRSGTRTVILFAVSESDGST
jgi:hypothetical protein